jgi:hypothetical protein
VSADSTLTSGPSDPTAATLPRAAAASLTTTGEEPAQLGRYKLLRMLGQGSMGVVYTAFDAMLDRVIALKLVRSDRSSPDNVSRFIREGRALARLSHPNVVQVHDVSASGGHVYLAMEHIRGRTLREALAEDRDPAHVRELFLQAGRGLEAIHRAGLVHRDFKPDNVMVGDDGRVRVMDLGLARIADEPPPDDEAAATRPDGQALELTAAGAVLGTPAYMAPEQHRGATADARSDVFSFCTALYEALYGERPFAGDSYEGLRDAALAGAVRPPARAQVPAWLRDVALRGLHVDPAARWPGMGPLLAALADDPAEARRRRWRRAGLAALVAALAVAGTAAVIVARRHFELVRRETLAAARLDAALSEDRPERAEAAFRAFVADPAHHGTRALGLAWQRHGDRRRAAGDADAALADYARAYADARDPPAAQAAMRRIAEVLRATWNTAALGRAAQALDPDPNDRALGDFLVDAALRRRDLAGAAARLAGDPDAALADAAPLLRTLAVARELPGPVGQAAVLPPGGAHPLAVVDPSGRELTLLGPDLRPAHRWRADEQLYLVRGGPWAFHRRGATVDVLDVRAPERRVFAFPAPGGADAQPRAVFDFDADGLPELLYRGQAPTRGVRLLDGLEAAPSERSADPQSEAADSDVEAALVADLDGDGVDEVVMAIGPHRAFDLRVFHAGADGRLELAARTQVGHVTGLAALRRPGGGTVLAAAVGDGPVSVDVFPDPPHTGIPPGIHLFEWTGQALRRGEHLPHPYPTAGDVLVAADLDGDGVDELAASFLARDRAHALLVRQAPAGLQPLVIGHGFVLDAPQLDDDPARELLLLDTDASRLWLLGAGDTPLAPAPAPAAAPAPPPPGLDDELLRDRWSRAELLDEIGLPASAAEILRESAALVPDPATRRRFTDRAAALFAAAGDTPAALDLSAEVLADPDLAPAALLRRVELLTDLARYAEATADVERLRAHPAATPEQAAAAAAAAARLAPLQDPAEVLDLRFDVPLAPGWRVLRPAALRRDVPTGELHVETLGTLGALAELQVEWDGGPIHLELELDVTHAEYDTVLRVGLLDAEGRPWLGVGVGGGGHREDRYHNFNCQAVGQYARNFARRGVPSAATPHRAVLRAVYFPDRRTSECVVDGGDLRARAEYTVRAPPPPGRHTLRLGRLDGGHSPHLVVADIRRITLRGLRLVDAPADAPVDRAARALVDGDPLAALAALGRADPPAAEGDPPAPRGPTAPRGPAPPTAEGDPPAPRGPTAPRGPAPPTAEGDPPAPRGPAPPAAEGDPPRVVVVPTDAERRATLELLARDDLRDAAGVARALPAAVAALGDDDLIHLLRTRPGLSAELRAAAGPRGLPALARAWEVLARHHLGDPDVQRRLLDDLRGLDARVPTRDAERAALGDLLFARGLVRQRLGDGAGAGRDLEAALATLGAADPALRARVHRQLALMLSAVDPARAYDHAARAVADDPSPELVRDRLARDPAIALLAARDPRWRALLAPP